MVKIKIQPANNGIDIMKKINPKYLKQINRPNPKTKIDKRKARIGVISFMI